MYKRAHLYFLLALLVAIAGFYPSYYSRIGSTDPVRQFHGVMATSWLLMLIAQSWLMARRRLQWHRRLGRLSLVVVPLFVLSGLLVVHDMLGAQDRGFVKAFGTLLGFMDLTTIAYFAWTYCMALVHRKNVQLHARYMASTVVLLLPPALARLMAQHLPFIQSFMAAVHAGYFVIELVIVALLVNDLRNGGLRKPYLILLGFTLFQHAGTLFTSRLVWLQDLCRAFGAL